VRGGLQTRAESGRVSFGPREAIAVCMSDERVAKGQIASIGRAKIVAPRAWTRQLSVPVLATICGGAVAHCLAS